MSTMRNTFDQIAPGWYHFRHWSIFRPELEAVAGRWQRGRLINIGCAHGPDFLPFREGFELHGMDFSTGMLKNAKKYAKKFKFSVKLVEADIRNLPYAEEAFDHAIAVATYHHILDKEGRLKAMQELHRVLKPGGEAFITAWNRWQSRFWFSSRDIQVPWRTNDIVLYRYYHLFSYGELEKLVKQAGFEVLKSSPERAYRFPLKSFSRNICILVRKG